MLTPTIANRYLFFYAAGNTPATNLARSVPHGQDADILSLGCGDLRYILYTSYVQRGLPARKLDITCCDYDDKVVGRNIILLTLILDGSDKVSPDELWDIYYHLYVNDQTAKLVGEHVQKLKPWTASLEAWRAGPYASMIDICDQDTLQDVRKVCSQVGKAAEKRASQELALIFSHYLDSSRELVGDGAVATGMRSAAPLALQSTDELPDNFKYYWSHGTVKGTEITAKTPNPMFSGLITATEMLHYGTDPLLGYHLATAFANLYGTSPLQPKVTSGETKLASAARVQFCEWVQAFQTPCKKRQIVLRFVISEVFSLCHTLQHARATGKVSANWYRRQWDNKVLRLDEKAYGPGSKAPTTFDVIETSNLSDHCGMLNIGVAAGPLLKPREWSTIHTDQLVKRDGPEQQALDSLLCGPSSNVSLLLGLTPFQYWTNSKLDSHVDEIYLGMMTDGGPSKETQLHSRLAWRRDDQLGKDDPGRTRLRMEPKALAKAVFEIYRQMFENENTPDDPFKLMPRYYTYGHFHRGSFVALLKVIQTRVKTDWPVMCVELLEIITQDRTMLVGAKFIQEMVVNLHLSGLYTEAWIVNTPKTVPQDGPFQGWRDLPPTVAVTLIVPRSRIARLFSDEKADRMTAPTFVGSLKSSAAAPNKQWHNMYADMHLTWGKASTSRDPETGDVVVNLERDELGWAGTSPLIASFTVPTEAILEEPKTALVGIFVLPSSRNFFIFGFKLGADMKVFESTIANASEVLISRQQPGQTGNIIMSGGAKPLEDEIPPQANGEGPITFTAEADGKGKITKICGHLSISSDKGRKRLSDKVPIELRQSDPFVIEIVFAKTQFVYPLRYPIPVTKDGSKTRIARTSGYIEVIAPLAEPAASNILVDYISPSVLTASGLPVALNAPHINLDCLPILDVQDKKALGWLTPLTSLTFSSREKLAREATDAGGMAADTRTNFKESLFTMFMLSSGLQGGQTGLFTISQPDKGGVHMIILVSAIRICGEAASVVLDAAVIPLTTRLIESRKLEEFLIIFDGLQSVTIKTNDEELLLWKKILPAMAERCRTWSHTPHCEYRQRSATVPVSLEFGDKILCSCGNGKLPDSFVGIPGWEEASSCATRIAISPTYAVPFVEEVVDKSGFGERSEDLEGGVPRCRKCLKKKGNGVKLKTCSRCLTARYCSVECQKADWEERHKKECEKKN